jgi:hypothetical protein
MWLVVVWRVVDRNNNKIMATIAWTCGGRSDPLMSLPCGAHRAVPPRPGWEWMRMWM